MSAPPSGSRVRGIDASVGAHEAVAGAADQHAVRSARSSSADSSSTTCTVRGSFACSAAGARRAPRRRPSARADHRTLRLRHRLLGDRHELTVAASQRSPSSAPRRSARRGRRRPAPPAGRRRLAPRGSPRPRGSARSSSRAPRGAFAAAPSTARVRSAPARGSPASRARSASRSAPVSMSSNSDGTLLERGSSIPRARRQLAMALAAAGAEARDDHIGGASSSRWCRSRGDPARPPRRRARARRRRSSSSLSSSGPSAGQSPGMHSTRSIPATARARRQGRPPRSDSGPR